MPSWTKEQEEAIYKSGTNIIVSAGAGSGKTAVLSERVLNKLKNGVNIDELLILTFTKAAALEMKERIRKKISKEPSLHSQLNKIDNAYITTFDSYALAIVKKYNYLINVDKNIAIAEKSIIDLKKSNIIDDVFEHFYEIEDSDFLNLIDDFCTKDDKEIKDYILSINNKLDMIYEKEKYLNSYLDSYYGDEFIDKKIAEYENLLLNKIGIINNYLLELEEYVEVEYYEKVNDSLGELLLSTNYNSIKQNLKTLPNLPRNSGDEAKKIKEHINNNLKELNDLCCYDTIIEIKESIYKTKDVTRTIIKIIKEFDKRIKKYKTNNDLYEFNDIAIMAITILEQNPKVREELKNSLNEILIDEYQDTNDLQELFISYIENNNVYMVGDIKQSIYRFRNANPNLFKNKYDNYSDLNGGLKIDLNKNFRSREEVLDDINLIFDVVMDNKIGGAEYSKSHRMIFGNKTYNEEGKLNHSNNLEIYNYFYDKNSEYKKEEIEIFIIANDIKQKIENHYQVFDKDTLQKRDIEYSDIAILMDRATNFNLYKQIFEYLNIPLSVYKDESITDSFDISIIKNILNLIINKKYNQKFKYSFISILRSYLFNENDSDIFKYFVNNNYNESDLMKIINSIDYSNMTPRELLVEIIDKFSFYEKMITVGNIQNHIIVLDYLVELATNLSDIGYTINDFYDYLDSILKNKYEIKFAQEKEKQGVKIMTIHKSKGLEYHICYYSGLYAKFNTSDLKERFIYDNGFGIICPYFDNGIRQIIYKPLLKEKYLQEEISEKIRLFYVALTRAKEKMILIAPLSDENININEIVPDNIRISYTSFLDIINSVKQRLINNIKNIDLKTLKLTKDYNFVKKNNYENIIEKDNRLLNVEIINIENNIIKQEHFSKIQHTLIQKDDFENMRIGTRIHSILENIDFKNPNYQNLTFFEQEKVKKFIETGILDNVLNIYKEYEFTYEVENIVYHGIIDLLLEYENEFKIIDYKLKNTVDDAYLEQLRGYKKYINSLTNKEVKTYLYSIIDEKLEIVE